jgi:hypothetical protein
MGYKTTKLNSDKRKIRNMIRLTPGFDSFFPHLFWQQADKKTTSTFIVELRAVASQL